MARVEQITRIPMQLGSVLRLGCDGEIALSNPEVELEPGEAVADAVLSYRFDAERREHVIGLVEPLSFKPRP